MMANPYEFHTTMYEIFWNGNAPQKRTGADGKDGDTKLVPKKQMDELEELKALAAQLRAAKAGESSD